MMDLEKKAKDAMVDDDFELAVDLYTQAIALNPSSSDLYADRAQANIKLQSFTEAVADANKAIEMSPSLTKAYLRKGTACIKLEEYQTAKTALEIGASLAPEDSRFTKMIKECDEHIAAEAAELPKPLADETHKASAIPNNLPSVVGFSGQGTSLITKPKYRHEFYQKPEEVVVTIFAKGIPTNCVVVDFGEQKLSLTITLPGEEPYIFQPRLFAKIIPGKCKYEVMSTKIEIRLAKAEPIHQWTSLEYSRDSTAVKKPIISGNPKPTYPSSKPKSTDWDKLEAQVKMEEKNEKLEGDAALNKFFRDIYKDGDEDARRAMSKSFVESNGTVLSTNWKEVGTKKVEGSAPDGMELKKWE